MHSTHFETQFTEFKEYICILGSFLLLKLNHRHLSYSKTVSIHINYVSTTELHVARRMQSWPKLKYASSICLHAEMLKYNDKPSCYISGMISKSKTESLRGLTDLTAISHWFTEVWIWWHLLLLNRVVGLFAGWFESTWKRTETSFPWRSWLACFVLHRSAIDVFTNKWARC